MSESILVNQKEISSSDLKTAADYLQSALNGLMKAYNNMTDYDSKLINLYEYESGFVFSGSSSDCIYNQANTVRSLSEIVRSLSGYCASIPKAIERIDDSFWSKSFNEYYQDIKNPIVGGITTAVGFWSELFSVANGTVRETTLYFQQHGVVYKVFQTGKAIVSSITSVAAVVGAGIISVGSGGAGAPLVALSAIYAGNTLGSNISDIINVWSGNYEDVGKTNWLKSTLAENYGMVFGEDVGKAIGNTIYTTGGILDTLTKLEVLTSKVIQSGDLWKQLKGAINESGSYVKGLIDIALYSDIGSVKLDLALLGYQTPSIGKVKGTVELLKKVGKSAEKLTKYAVNTICDIVTNIPEENFLKYII